MNYNELIAVLSKSLKDIGMDNFEIRTNANVNHKSLSIVRVYIEYKFIELDFILKSEDILKHDQSLLNIIYNRFNVAVKLKHAGAIILTDSSLYDFSLRDNRVRVYSSMINLMTRKPKNLTDDFTRLVGLIKFNASLGITYDSIVEEIHDYSFVSVKYSNVNYLIIGNTIFDLRTGLVESDPVLIESIRSKINIA